jgi:ABC-type uncharacterized transport system substrate-binding protein
MKKCLSLLFLMLLPYIYAQGPPGEEEAIKNILIIHSYHQGLYWTDSISKGIVDGLSGENVDFHYEYLDTKRNPGENYYDRLVKFEVGKHQLSKIDYQVIICSDNNALRFLMDYRDTLYPGIPIVFCGINNYTPALLNNHENITGVVEYIDYQANLELMAHLHPKRNHLVIIVDETPTGKSIKDEILPILEGFSSRFSFEFYQDFQLDEVPEYISHLGENDIIYLLTFNRDRKGNFISYFDGIAMIRQSSQVPIYGSWDFYFDNGIMGGYLTTGKSQGLAAAELTRQILNGTPISSLPVIEQCPLQISFDYEELNRFQICEKDLPAGSVVINQPSNLFQRNTSEFITLFFLLFFLFILLIIRDLQQKKKAKKLSKMNKELAIKVQKKTIDLTEKITLIEKQNEELKEALDQIRTLKGIIPICSHCKSVRNDQGYWNKVEKYLADNTDAVFSHSLCPECLEKYYPEEMDELRKKKDTPS